MPLNKMESDLESALAVIERIRSDLVLFAEGRTHSVEDLRRRATRGLK